MKGMRQLGAIVGAILLTAIVATPASARGANATTQVAGTQPATRAAGTTQPDRRVTKHGWFPMRVRKDPAPKLPAEVERAYVIPIRDRKYGITHTTYESIKNKVTLCRGKGAQLVIFDMDTPGGSVAAMQRIVALITGELNDIYTIAYVRNEAISAGAIISLACDEIIMAPTGKIGDAMPIMVSPGGQLAPMPKAEREKAESYLRSDLRLLAERIGHNVPLCNAMITLPRKVWLIRKPQTRELKLVDPDESNWQARVSGSPSKGSRRPALNENEWEFIKQIDGDNELLTKTADEAMEIGLVDHIIEAPTKDPFEGLKKHYNITGDPVILGDSWSESLVAFLTSPTVTGILMMLAMMCVYAEFNMPGFGVAGGVAIACFTILFGSHFLIGLAHWWEIGLFCLGLILIGLEIFVIPGFGVAGISGIICCIVGLMAIVVPNAPTEFPWPKTDLDWSWFAPGLYALGLGFAGGVIGAVVLAQFLPKIPLANRLVLGAAQAASDAPATADAPIMHIKVGDTGTVETMCRPVGQVRFGRELCDATADGTTIEVGVKVRVIERTGNQLIVKEV
jgi:membrane-bound serine protease (ClpP class)